LPGGAAAGVRYNVVVTGPRLFGAVWLSVCLACGGSQPDALHPSEREAEQTSDAASEPEASQAAPAPDESAAPGLPKECTPVGDLCLPPRAFVKRLCQDAFTGAAIRLFEKSSPFSRGYITRRDIKAVNTLGGPSSDVNLDAGEEVLILTRSAGPGASEMQVSGMGGYEVLRWDGTCATLSDGELATRPPHSLRHGPLDWRYIDTNIQKALLANEGIVEARREQRKHCKGVTVGRVSSACAKADARFYESVVSTVRGGIDLPDPERLP
jgi:hypothetical protein